MCCIQFPTSQVLTEVFTVLPDGVFLCASQSKGRGVVGLLALSFGHESNAWKGVSPVACCHGWGLRATPKGLATLQCHQSSAASHLADQFRSAFLLFSRELVQKISFNRFLKNFCHIFITSSKQSLPHLHKFPREGFQWSFFLPDFLLFWEFSNYLLPSMLNLFLGWLPLILHCQNDPQKKRLVQILLLTKMWLFKLLT